RVLLRPLPFPRAEQLVALESMDSLRHVVEVVSSADWQDWQREAKSMQSTAIYSLDRRMGIADADSATRVSAREVSGSFFRVLGARFTVGRPFTEAEAQAQTPVVVVSEALWRRLLGADRSLARPIKVGSRSYAVVGVVAAGFDYPTGTEVWFADAFGPESGGMHNNINWLAIARLNLGVTRAAAAAELDAAARRIRTREPRALYAYGVNVKPLRTVIVGSAAGYLQLLMAAVGFVLLIVCANVASATLGRGMARAREMAVRASLGAGRGRLIRQLLIEHVMLALIGGAIGLALAWAGIRVLLNAWGSEIPRAEEVRLDPVVFAFAFGMSLLVGIMSGLLPAFRGSRVSLRGLMASGGRTMASGRSLPGNLLASAEIALALLLLSGAGLLIEAFRCSSLAILDSTRMWRRRRW
ncbi:MAG: ABC transporter permease, partial [Gemmatimonadota bacterium]|nr:ABC transporter permease [Gemmatimonadota bacterium]